MERNFLGLGSKNSPITVKEETSESSRDSAPNRGNGMKWSFSNKVSAASSELLSFRPSQEDIHRKSGNYHLQHSVSFMPSSVSDVYDSTRKAPYTSVQRVRMFPNSNQHEETKAVSMSMSNFQSHHYAQGGRSFTSNNNNSQPLVGVKPFQVYMKKKQPRNREMQQEADKIIADMDIAEVENELGTELKAFRKDPEEINEKDKDELSIATVNNELAVSEE